MNLRQVRKKIKSISNVKKITKALQLVSAVKMRKAQAEALNGEPYRQGLEEIIRKIAGNVDPTSSELFRPKRNTNGRKLVIFITSNKGLCGAFHLNINRFLLKQVGLENTDFITVGHKGASFAARMGGSVIADFSEGTAISHATAIFGLAVEKYLNGEYKSVSIVYNKFISTLRSSQKQDIMLPLELPTDMEQKPKDSVGGSYAVEPSPEEIMDALLRSYLEEKVRGAIQSSEAVEHSVRMIAMKNATDNAQDVIYSLTLLSNRIRQTKITYELLDMVTAKESVEGNQ